MQEQYHSDHQMEPRCDTLPFKAHNRLAQRARWLVRTLLHDVVLALLLLLCLAHAVQLLGAHRGRRHFSLISRNNGVNGVQSTVYEALRYFQSGGAFSHGEVRN